MLEESKRSIKIENIEDEVLNGGVSGARDAISFLQSFHDNNSIDISSSIKEMEKILKSISPRTLNFIAVNEFYRKQIFSTVNKKTSNGKKEISNTTHLVAELISTVEERLNKSILSAKRIDVKTKRQKEKKIVLTFYKSSKNDIKKIFDLINLLIRVKNKL